jgi:D-cysteine desulfhydrase
MGMPAVLTQYPLFEAYPRIGGALPVAGLLSGPTPVEPFGNAAGLYLKRDDLSAPDYGGNKVRKLDFILASVEQRGIRDIITFGYTGSNFVAATAAVAPLPPNTLSVTG